MSINRKRKDGGENSSPGNSSPENLVRYSQSVEPPSVEFPDKSTSLKGIVKPKPEKVGLSK